jgi:NAD(P)-dependent dehydrogenase (short-subunit alcohol dehydrogenase family)
MLPPLLDGQVAIVSGVGPGLGRDIALALARAGADLVLAARTPERLAEVAVEVEALGRRVLCVPADIRSSEACHEVVRRATEAFGGIDVLVNNAYHPGTLTLFEKDDLDRWREVLDVNLLGALRLTQAVVPVMKERGGGSVVMISTMSTRVVNPMFASYAASKAGMNAATQGLARELGRHGCRATSGGPP